MRTLLFYAILLRFAPKSIIRKIQNVLMCDILIT